MARETARLLPSVITSSAVVPLPDLFHEVLDIHGDVSFDLMVLRPEDADPVRAGIPGADPDRITDLVAGSYDAVRSFLTGVFRAFRQARPGRRLRLAALATYFPDISSTDEGRRTKACTAVVNCVRLCRDLADEPGLELDVVPCVEVVCGSVLEPVHDGAEARPTWVKTYSLAAKAERLMQSLRDVRRALAGGRRFALALELEPGASYVLNDHKSLKLIYDSVRQEGLDDVVGLNLDIAHFRIAGISPAFLRGEAENGVRAGDMAPWLVHSHIADHPLGMHTRDLALGAFTNLEHFPTGLCGYLDILMDRAAHAAADPAGLLFTNSVALELEGCSRLGWLHNSLVHLRRLLRAAEARRHASG